jgi:hypothetical protein
MDDWFSAFVTYSGSEAGKAGAKNNGFLSPGVGKAVKNDLK